MTLNYELIKDYENDQTICLKVNRKGLNIGLLILDKEQTNPRNYKEIIIK